MESDVIISVPTTYIKEQPDIQARMFIRSLIETMRLDGMDDSDICHVLEDEASRLAPKPHKEGE